MLEKIAMITFLINIIGVIVVSLYEALKELVERKIEEEEEKVITKEEE